MIHIDDEVGMALENGMIEHVRRVNLCFYIFLESIIYTNLESAADGQRKRLSWVKLT